MSSGSVRIWDAWVRLFHWSLALAVGFQLFSGETSWQFFDWHRPVGEFILALLVFRIMWGIVGSSNASLRSLVQSPRSALEHLAALFRRDLQSERGHNAAGGWAVLIMLVLLLTQGVTGFFIADEDEFIEGALYGSLSDAGTSLAWQIHQFNADLILIVVAVHILMVFAYLLYAGQNLIRPMLTGWMKWPETASAPAVRFQHAWVGAGLLALALVAVGALAGWL